MSTSGQFIDKLVEKCRRGDDKACSELRSYREFLEERLKSSEYLFISNLIVIFITLMSQKFIINILTEFTS